MFFSLWLLVNLIQALASGSSPITSIAELLKEESDVHHLPENVEPKSYDLKLIPNLVTFTFAGIVGITVDVLSSTDVIKLHSKHLKITNVRLVKESAKTTEIRNAINFNEKHDFLVIKTEKKLSPTRYVLTISFDGNLNEGLVGFYKSSYTTTDGEKKWLAFTHFEANHAREAFPCFDEPRFRATFSTRIARNSDQITISNSHQKSQLSADTANSNIVWDIYARTMPIPTYLVSFAVCEFKASFEYSYSNGKIILYSKEDVIEKSHFLLKQSQKLLEEYYAHIGSTFDISNLDFVSLPDMKLGAMQNWRMPTFREIYTTLDENSCAEIQKTMVTLAASHEIACQWFGGLVSPQWWDDTWLIHGFAGYFEYYMTAKIEPKWNLEELFIFEEVQSTLWTEITCQRAITSKITKPFQLKNLYNVIAWDKASCIIRMLEYMVTSKIFKQGILNYLIKGVEDNERSTTSQTFFEAFEDKTVYPFLPLPPTITLTEVLRTWTDNIGFPLINVAREQSTNKIIIEQTTYKSPRAPQPLPDQEWIVLVTCTTKSEWKSDSFRSIWSIDSSPVSLGITELPSDDWILCNLDTTGYYRVNYDHLNWQLLINYLMDENRDEIPATSRAQLLDDALALAYDEIINYSVPLQLAKYLEKELDMLPWLSATFHFDLLYSELEQTADIHIITKYIENLIEKLTDHFGFDIKPSDTHIFKVGYPSILSLACKIEMKKCVANSLQQYRNNVDDLNKLQPDLKDVVFCTALANSPNPEDVWDNLWKLYKTADSSYLRVSILTKLGCAKDDKTLKKTLSKLIEPSTNENGIKYSDKNFVINSFFYSSRSVTSFIEFLFDQLPVITKYDDKTLTILTSMAGNLASKVQNNDQLILLNFLKTELKQLHGERYEGLKEAVKTSYKNGFENIKKNSRRIERIKDSCKMTS